MWTFSTTVSELTGTVAVVTGDSKSFRIVVLLQPLLNFQSTVLFTVVVYVVNGEKIMVRLSAAVTNTTVVLYGLYS